MSNFFENFLIRFQKLCHSACRNGDNQRHQNVSRDRKDKAGVGDDGGNQDVADNPQQDNADDKQNKSADVEFEADVFCHCYSLLCW